MKTVLTAVIALLFSMSVFAKGDADNPSAVTVENEPTVHVGSMPNVSGTVSISGTPSVNVSTLPAVSLSGTPSVSISGTPSVDVSSLPAVTVESLPDLTVSDGGIPYSSFGAGPAGSNVCDFGLPIGTYLRIESINGYTRLGNVTYISVLGSVQQNTDSIHLPNTFATGINYLYENNSIIYAGDGDRFDDGMGSGTDLRVIINHDSSGDLNGNTVCNITGMLYDLP